MPVCVARWTLCRPQWSVSQSLLHASRPSMRLFHANIKRSWSLTTPTITSSTTFLRGAKQGLSWTAAAVPLTSPCVPKALVIGVGIKVAYWDRIKVAFCEAALVPPLRPAGLRPAKVVVMPPSAPPSVLRDMWDLIKPDLLLLCCIIASAIAAALIHLQTPIVTGQLINVITSASAAKGFMSLEALNGPASRLFGLLSMQGVLTFVHIALVSVLGENVAKRLRAKLFGAIVRQDMMFFDVNRSGELVGRLTTDVADFKHTFKQLVTQGLKAVTQTVGSAIHLFRLSTPLTVTMCATMPVLYVLLNIYGAYLRKLSRQGKILDGKASGVAGEVISNMRTVRAFANEDKEMEHYGNACEELASSNRRLGTHIGLFQGLTNISIGCMVLVVLYYGGSLVLKNEMTGGELMSYMLSTQTAQQSLVSLGVLFGQTIKAAASASRVFEFIHLEPVIPLRGGMTLDDVQGHIAFENIEFYYPSRPEHRVLDNFSLHVTPGTTVALCGPSGSGKSTIASLLERFYEPFDGQVYLDGHALTTLDPSWLRQHIGFINQEPVLFATTILENIRYGCPDATMEEVRQAARMANAEAFIESFPDGYNTVVGERGASLSGGQKQRIAIARAILKNPKILVLDEATSALDTQSEKVVQEALDKVMKGRTVLVIAHRLSTIRAADTIVVMGRVPGNIIEQGTHDELLAKRGAYYRLHSQLENAQDNI